MAEYSGTRLYLGNLPKDSKLSLIALLPFGPSCASLARRIAFSIAFRKARASGNKKDQENIREQESGHERSNADRIATARKQEVEAFFNEYGHGTITEVKLMDGFGFIQYDNPDDAKDIVPCQCTPLQPYILNPS
jgi:RNA recognition motif-containing protein